MYISLLKLILNIPFLLVLPGMFFQAAIFGWKNKKMAFLERAVLSVPFSLIIVDLIVLLLNRMNILIKGPILIFSVLLFSAVCFAVFHWRFEKKKKTEKDKGDPEKIFDFSAWQTVFILLSLFLAVFIRVAYLSDTIIPSATDLGHHMYWVQTIINTGHLPDYGMPDFIIGEHMIFAAANLVSGVGVMTSMPAILLLFFNIFGIFTMAILVGRIFRNPNMAAVSFFVAGALYAINPPQGRYVSGGVIGNVIGDMLIPVSIYFFYRAFSEKNSLFAGLFLFSFGGLLYTHHLSTFVLIFSVAAITILHLALNFKNIFQTIVEWIRIYFNPFPIAIILLFAAYFFLIFTPSYFNTAAVGQATGEPSKATRVGLALSQIDGSVGSALLILGVLGFLLILFEINPKKIKYSVALGWLAIVFLMAWKPGWLFVNIPSDRVGNYLYLPLVFLASFGMVKYFESFRASASRFFATVFLFTILFFVITNGLSDSADVFKSKNMFQQAMETFHSGEYLAATTDPNQDVILKDHVNIYADSWYKLFFMKDYKYPLSRGNLSRYIDPTKPRETCTRDMISTPETEAAKACFSETGVNYVVVNAQSEGTSFQKYPDFSQVYASDYIAIFKRD
ncbi:MAG: DUF1616 domain-containing protein [Candidatus Moranbacteria bacterium]|nr:DUF1616 domain-containing protein [Candidatus Moranbacteria bacterium]